MQCWWSGLRAAAGLSASICGLSGARVTRASTSMHELLWLIAAASICRLHVQLVSRCLVSVRLHSERCRPYPRGTLGTRALCNGRHDLHSPPQIYHKPKRPINIVYTSSPAGKTAGNQK